MPCASPSSPFPSDFWCWERGCGGVAVACALPAGAAVWTPFPGALWELISDFLESDSLCYVCRRLADVLRRRHMDCNVSHQILAAFLKKHKGDPAIRTLRVHCNAVRDEGAQVAPEPPFPLPVPFLVRPCLPALPPPFPYALWPCPPPPHLEPRGRRNPVAMVGSGGGIPLSATQLHHCTPPPPPLTSATVRRHASTNHSQVCEIGRTKRRTGSSAVCPPSPILFALPVGTGHSKCVCGERGGWVGGLHPPQPFRCRASGTTPFWSLSGLQKGEGGGLSERRAPRPGPMNDHHQIRR